jgi:hypothetical protein
MESMGGGFLGLDINMTAPKSTDSRHRTIQRWNDMLFEACKR